MFLAVRDLRFARGRFGLMAAVVGLITVLVVLLTGLASGLSGQSISAVTSLPADHLSFAAPASGEKVSFTGSRVTAAQVPTAASQPGVRSAALLGMAPGRLSVHGTDLPVTAFGVDPGGFLAPAGLSPEHVVVSSELATERDIAVGDRVALGGHELTVAGLRDDASFNHTPVVWVDRAAWSDLDAAGGAEGTVIALRTDGTFDPGRFDEAVGSSTATLGGALSAIGSYTAENGSLTLIRMLLMAVSALVVGAFFTVWTIQRSPDLAVLKAMGASTAYLVRDALAQTFVVLLVGGAGGTLLATGLGWVASGSVPFVITAGTTLVPLAGLLVLGMVGGVAALRRIATVDPLTALGAAR